MTDPTSQAPAGFEEEALPHLDAVYRFALRLSGAPDQAEDLVQETFLRAYRSWDQYTRGTAAKSWLFTICRNVFLRKRERRQRHDEIVEEKVDRSGVGKNPVNPVWVSVVGVDPEGDFFDSIVDGRIIEAIEELPEEYRTAVVLSDVEGLPYAEISELMGVPVGTVKSRLFRGRRRLQQRLYDYAVEEGYISERSGTDEP
ncbi:MAG: sigma-70 family RNA polymerase sigma factor [Longimicrobiales bacterium]|nr:sigma-70 family RNA polymerase sigma factor [Longimicrobiales bacterium]